MTYGCCPRPTCTCTSPGRCGPRTLLELADKYGVHLPDGADRRRAAAAAGHRRARLVPLPAALRHRPVLPALARGHPAAGARGRRGGRARTARGGWRSRSTPPRTRPLLGGLIPAHRDHPGRGGPAPPATPGSDIRVVVAANRMKHPLDARTLARLAVRYADRGVVGFGLSNDERRGMARDFDRAFAIAREGGLLAAPHGGELSGPSSVRDCLDDLRRGPDRARRTGRRGPAAAGAARRARGDLRGLPGVERGARRLREARGRTAAHAVRRRGADGARRRRPAAVRLPAGRAVRASRARHHGFTDAELAELARQSVRGSAAPVDGAGEAAGGIDAWLGG